MYLYFLSKKTQGVDALWENIKSKYKVTREALILSLEDYINASRKSNLNERILVAILILESIHQLPFFDRENTKINLKKDEFGKPYFDNSNIRISITHNEDFALVAYAEGLEIGVDIENEIPPEKAKRLADRYANIEGLNTEQIPLKMSVFEMDEKSTFKPVNLALSDNSFTAKWTAAEAIMKCDGRGFSALPEIESLVKSTKVNTYIFEQNGKKHYVSIAQK